jgi:AcrR family transcriptional regulator
MSIEERRREEKEQRRHSIVDAAETALKTKRVEDLTMSDVSSNARLSRSLLYVYFEDLDDIVLAVTRRGFQNLLDRFRKAVGHHDTGLMQIRAIGEALRGLRPG